MGTWTTIASGLTYEAFGAVTAMSLGNGLALANGWDLGGIERVVVTAAESAFLPPDERRTLVETVIRPAFDRLARPAAES